MGVGVEVGVRVGVAVAVGSGVMVGVSVAVGLGVGESIGAAVAVGTPVAVAVGVSGVAVTTMTSGWELQARVNKVRATAIASAASAWNTGNPLAGIGWSYRHNSLVLR